MRTPLSLAVIGLAAVPAAAQQNAGPDFVFDNQLSSATDVAFRNCVASDLDGNGRVDVVMNRADDALWLPDAGTLNMQSTLKPTISDLCTVRLGAPFQAHNGYGPVSGGATAPANQGMTVFIGESYGIATVATDGVRFLEFDSSGVQTSTAIDAGFVGATLIRNGDFDDDSRQDVAAFKANANSTEVRLYLQTASGWTTGNTFTIPYPVVDACCIRYDGSAGTEIVAAFDGGMAIYRTGHGAGAAGEEFFARVIPGLTNTQVEPLPEYISGDQDAVLWAGRYGPSTIIAPVANLHAQPPLVFSGVELERLEAGYLNDDDHYDAVFSSAGESKLYALLGQSHGYGDKLFIWDLASDSNTTAAFSLTEPVLAGSQSQPLIQDLNDDGIAELMFGIDQSDRILTFEGSFGGIPNSFAGITNSSWGFDTGTGGHLFDANDNLISPPPFETNELMIGLQWNSNVFDMSGGVEVAVFAQEDVSHPVFAEAIEGCDDVTVVPHSGQTLADGVGSITIPILDDPTPVSSYSAFSSNASGYGNSDDWGDTDQLLHVMIRPKLPNAYGRRPTLIMAAHMHIGLDWPTVSQRSGYNPSYIVEDSADPELYLTTSVFYGGITPYTGAKRIKRSGFGGITPSVPNNCGTQTNN